MEGSTDPRVERAFFIVEPNRKQLTDIAELLDAGKLRTVVDSVIPFSEAAGVVTGTVSPHGRGKLVVEISYY